MNLVSLRNRMKTVKNIYQVVHSMETLATMKIMKLRTDAEKRRIYAEKLRNILISLSSILPPEIPENVLLYDKHISDKNLVILVTSDRGFSGSMNLDIERKTKDFIVKLKNPKLISIGKKIGEKLINEGYDVVAIIDKKLENVNLNFAKNLASDIVTSFLNDEYDNIYVVSTEFINIVQQNTVVKKIIPLQSAKENSFLKKYPYEHFLFNPEPKKIFSILVRNYVDVFIYSILLDAAASEQAIRMMTMHTATENAEETIKALKLSYQRIRQEKITSELNEISTHLINFNRNEN